MRLQRNTRWTALFMALPSLALANESGMPQLDPTYYPSQLFWLAVTGVALYLVLAKFALPRVAGMVGARDAQIQKDLAQAYHLKQQAEDIKIAYMKLLRDADEQAHVLVDQIMQELKEKNDTQLANTAAKIDQKIAETEEALHTQKTALMADIDGMAEKLSATILAQLTKEGV